MNSENSWLRFWVSSSRGTGTTSDCVSVYATANMHSPLNTLDTYVPYWWCEVLFRGREKHRFPKNKEVMHTLHKRADVEGNRWGSNAYALNTYRWEQEARNPLRSITICNDAHCEISSDMFAIFWKTSFFLIFPRLAFWAIDPLAFATQALRCDSLAISVTASPIQRIRRIVCTVYGGTQQFVSFKWRREHSNLKSFKMTDFSARQDLVLAYIVVAKRCKLMTEISHKRRKSMQRIWPTS